MILFGQKYRRIILKKPPSIGILFTMHLQVDMIWKFMIQMVAMLLQSTLNLPHHSASGISVWPDTTYGDYQIKCNGEYSGRWVIVNNNMTNTTYQWTSDNGFIDTFTNAWLYNYQSNMPAGHYFLHFTDISGCKGDWEIDLEEPAPLVIDSFTLSSYNGLSNVSCFGLSDGQIITKQYSRRP